MSLLSRRRCMLHEEKQWDYEWYPENEQNQFKIRKIPVKAGDRVIINYFMTPHEAFWGNKTLYNGGYVYDGRNVGEGFLNAFWSGNPTLNEDNIVEIFPTKDGLLVFGGYKDNAEGTIPRATYDVFTGKYIKVKIER